MLPFPFVFTSDFIEYAVGICAARAAFVMHWVLLLVSAPPHGSAGWAFVLYLHACHTPHATCHTTVRLLLHFVVGAPAAQTAQSQTDSLARSRIYLLQLQYIYCCTNWVSILVTHVCSSSTFVFCLAFWPCCLLTVDCCLLSVVCFCLLYPVMCRVTGSGYSCLSE